MKYEITILRYQGDIPIILQKKQVDAKTKEFNWDNKTYPINSNLISYYDADKKIGYIFFEHDNINQLLHLSELESEALAELQKKALTNLGDLDKAKLKAEFEQKRLDAKKAPIPLRLKQITKLALTATENDFFVTQNCVASIFSRLKNFGAGSSVAKTTLVIVVLASIVAGMIGFFVGNHYTSTKTVVEYLNSTQTNIPSV